MAKVAPKPINSTKRKMRIRDFLTLFKGSVGDVARRSLMRYSIFSVTPDVNNASVPIYHCIQLALTRSSVSPTHEESTEDALWNETKNMLEWLRHQNKT